MKKQLSRILIVFLLFVMTACGAEKEKEAAITDDATAESSDSLDNMTVHYLDVGEGLSVFVQVGDQNLIYDGGGRQSSSFVVSYLKKLGVKEIDYLISSHYDADHLAGLIGCLNAFEVHHIIGAGYEHDSDLYQSFVDTAAEKELPIQHPKVGNTFKLNTSTITILSPGSIQEESNANSVAMKIQNGDHSFILTGDANIAAESEMCASGINLDCDVLSIAHHGSASSTSMAFLEKTLPDFSIISCGSDNQYGHPHQDVLDKLSVIETELFRSDLQGTIIANSDGKKLTWDQKPCNDYTPGDLSDAGTQSQVKSHDPVEEITEEPDQDLQESPERTVWLSATGEKYHLIPNCGRMNPDTAREITQEEAKESEYEACDKCFRP